MPRVRRPGHTHKYLDAAGRWRGGTTRDDQIPLGRLSCADVVLGMSGAPVRRRDGAVVGVASARYNSADDWLRGTVWVARVENLVPLLDGLTEVHLAQRRSEGTTDLILTIGERQVRLSGSGRDVVAEHHGVSIALAEAVRGLAQARTRWTTRRGATAVTPGHPPNPEAIGRLLAESFLPHPVVDELATVIADAESRWAPVRLGVFAARLIARGASVVIGTETAVTDVYATRAFARIYGALASAETPDVLDAVAEARRTVQQELQRSSDKREQHLGVLGEWARGCWPARWASSSGAGVSSADGRRSW